MRLGYPGQNLSTEYRINRQVLLGEKFPEKIVIEAQKLAAENLHDLLEILKWNEENGLKFFRISSDICPQISN